MNDMFNVVSEVGEIATVLFSSEMFDECVRYIVDGDLLDDSDVFIQNQDGDIFGF
jgi:hypothetical protein